MGDLVIDPITFFSMVLRSVLWGWWKFFRMTQILEVGCSVEGLDCCFCWVGCS